MENRFNGIEKELCLLYALPHSNETEYMDFLLTLTQKYEIKQIHTSIELKVWMNSTDVIRPSIVITGLPAIHVDIKKILGFLSATQFICIGDTLDLEATFECANGNSFKDCYSFIDVIEFLELDYENSNHNHMNENNMGSETEEADSVDTLYENEENEENEDIKLQVTATDINTDTEIHASLRSITEYQEGLANNPEVINEQVPPSKPHITVSKEIETKSSQADTDKFEPSIIDSENLYNERSKNVQRGLFKDQSRENHRTIGIWSPLHRTGVTSLTMNFSMFLSDHRKDVVVVEGITSQFAMKDWLKRYTPVPVNWISCAKAIQTDVSAIHSKWKYSNIMFLPLDKSDSQYEWNTLSLDAYMNTTKVNDIDVTLVDMPTGEMAHYTLDTLAHLDELWIVVDDAIQETLAWKKYITDLKKSTKLPMSIIFNKQYSFSQAKRISKELGVHMIATIPSLHEETMKNYYEKEPLYNQEEVKEQLKGPYTVMANHLFEGKFTTNKNHPSKQYPGWLKRILAPINIGTNR